jgi:CheY-like chemotaxis protein
MKKRTILVVDDETTVRDHARAIFEHAGYEVTTAVDGSEAIALLALSDYDVVLLDIAMPRVDGLDVVGELLKSNNAGVLAHTYLLSEGDLDMLPDLPVSGVIGKPLDRRALIAEAKDCIGH